MATIINISGSLTGAAVVLGFVAVVRAVRTRRDRHSTRPSSGDGVLTYAPFHCELSYDAIKLLVATRPIPHYVIHVRSAEDSGEDAPPEMLGTALAVAEADVAEVLSSKAAWSARFPGQRPPLLSQLLVFVGSSERAMQQAAAAAAAAGMQRTCTLRGGLEACSSPPPPSAAVQPLLVQRELLALLLRVAQAPAGSLLPRCTALDVRRYDERALYGALPGTLHLPVDQLASALALAPDAFKRMYAFEMPAQGDLLIFVSRTNQRAHWAAQLAHDAGWCRVGVYTDGTYGWQYDSAVHAYASYQLGDPPPEPERFTPDTPDVPTGLEQLEELQDALQEQEARGDAAAMAASG